MSQLRTFVAIELDDAARQIVGRLARQLEKANDSLATASSDQSHLTLCFLGEVDLNDQHRVSRTVSQVFGSIGSFTLDLQGLGAFPHWNDPRVVWLGVREPGVTVDHLSEAARERLGSAAYCPNLVELQQALVDRFEDQQFFPDTKPYRPHITLGRVAGGKGQRKVGVSDSIRTQCDQGLGQLTVSEVKVLSSERTSSGPVYRTIATIDLDQERGA